MERKCSVGRDANAEEPFLGFIRYIMDVIAVVFPQERFSPFYDTKPYSEPM